MAPLLHSQSYLTGYLPVKPVFNDLLFLCFYCRTHLSHTVTFNLYSQGLYCLSFGATGLFSEQLLRRHVRFFSLCILTCLLKLWCRAPAASHLHCNAAGQVYNPLHGWATSHLSEHRGPPLCLEGFQWPLLPGHTQTHTHEHTPATQVK